MTTAAQLEQAMKMAKAKGYTVTPKKPVNEAGTTITEGPRDRALMENARIFALQESQSMQEQLDQLALENRLLKAQAGKPQRTSLVESHNGARTSNSPFSRFSKQRNHLAERMQKYGDLAQLADLEQPLPEGLDAGAMLRDFGHMMLYKDGFYGEF